MRSKTVIKLSKQWHKGEGEVLSGSIEHNACAFVYSPILRSIQPSRLHPLL